jgi:hypothetical protein
MNTHYRGCNLKNMTYIGGDMKVVCVDGSIVPFSFILIFRHRLRSATAAPHGVCGWVSGAFSSVSREEVGYHNELDYCNHCLPISIFQKRKERGGLVAVGVL